jgi:hypothetical protein
MKIMINIPDNKLLMLDIIEIVHINQRLAYIVQGTLNAVKCRDDILDPIVLPFLQQPNFDHGHVLS